MDSMEQQESADDAGDNADAAPIGWLDEILPVDPDEDEYMPWCWDDLEARKPFTTRQDFEDVRNLVKRQIQYDDLLKNQWKYNRERLDEIVESWSSCIPRRKPLFGSAGGNGLHGRFKIG